MSQKTKLKADRRAAHCDAEVQAEETALERGEMVDWRNFTWAVDISHWWHVDWALVPEFVQMALIRATEGDYLVDGCFQQHVEDALKAGKMVGLYHFYRTQIGGREVPADAQAEFFLHHTQPYWDDVSLRANIFRSGDYLSTAGEYYNLPLGSESEDLFTFHDKLRRSDWLAFDLLQTSAADWQEMGLEDPSPGPAWIKERLLIDGLWLAWHPYRRPRGPVALGGFVPASFSPRLPRPFTQYWAWQFTTDFLLQGLYTRDGLINKLAGLSVVPYPPEIVSQLLAAYELGETAVMEMQEVAVAHRAGGQRKEKVSGCVPQIREKEVQ